MEKCFTSLLPRYSLVAKFLKTDDCVYIVISSVKFDPLDWFG